MSNAEARAWWADVQHLRPDAAPDAPTTRDARRPARPALRSVEDLPSVEELDAWLEQETPRRFSARRIAEPEPPVADAPAPAPSPERRLEAVADPEPLRPELAPDPRWTTAADGRRTVQIKGRIAEPVAPRRTRAVGERAPRTNPIDRMISAPDRIALWAVILGVLLIVIAATSSSAQAAGF